MTKLITKLMSKILSGSLFWSLFSLLFLFFEKMICFMLDQNFGSVKIFCGWFGSFVMELYKNYLLLKDNLFKDSLGKYILFCFLMAFFICFVMAGLNILLRKGSFRTYDKSNTQFDLFFIFWRQLITFLIVLFCIYDLRNFYLALIPLTLIFWFFSKKNHPRFFQYWKKEFKQTYVIIFDDLGSYHAIPLRNKWRCFRLTFHVLTAAILHTPLGNNLIRWPVITSSVVIFFYLLIVGPFAYNETMWINACTSFFFAWNFYVFKSVLTNEKSSLNRFYYTAYEKEDTYKLLGLGDWTKESTLYKKESTTFKNRKKDQNE